ncbi:hypothetical protein DFJ77DRAFT_544445 [Powellomyces hirtus]|nr:hypothetical protein DFJ77DRAFT_544445 [Powellomyces hirtus]
MPSSDLAQPSSSSSKASSSSFSPLTTTSVYSETAAFFPVDSDLLDNTNTDGREPRLLVCGSASAAAGHARKGQAEWDQWWAATTHPTPTSISRPYPTTTTTTTTTMTLSEAYQRQLDRDSFDLDLDLQQLNNSDGDSSCSLSDDEDELLEARYALALSGSARASRSRSSPSRSRASAIQRISAFLGHLTATTGKTHGVSVRNDRTTTVTPLDWDPLLCNVHEMEQPYMR